MKMGQVGLFHEQLIVLTPGDVWPSRLLLGSLLIYILSCRLLIHQPPHLKQWFNPNAEGTVFGPTFSVESTRWCAAKDRSGVLHISVLRCRKKRRFTPRLFHLTGKTVAF